MKDIGLYIHIPYCIKKCSYCSFCSIPKGNKTCDDYIESVIREAKNISNEVKNCNINTVYIGGGTPTILDNGKLAYLINQIKPFFNFNPIEFTVEANPATLNVEKCEELIKMGANRISIGIQSINDNLLKLLNRQHSAKQGIESLRLAKKYFDNVSADLIIGLPGQTFEDIKNSVLDIVNENVNHISCYTLQLEEGTPLYNDVKNKKIVPLDQDLTADMYEYMVKLLKENGFESYEISNFAKDNKISIHNNNYWRRIDYIGLGASAHSLLNNVRYNNTSDIERYINGSKYENIENLTIDDQVFEDIMLGFRTVKGIDIKKFNEKYNVNFCIKYKNQLKKLKNYLNINYAFISIKQKYFEISSSIIVEFME